MLSVLCIALAVVAWRVASRASREQLANAAFASRCSVAFTAGGVATLAAVAASGTRHVGVIVPVGIAVTTLGALALARWRSSTLEALRAVTPAALGWAPVVGLGAWKMLDGALWTELPNPSASLEANEVAVLVLAVAGLVLVQRLLARGARRRTFGPVASRALVAAAAVVVVAAAVHPRARRGSIDDVERALEPIGEVHEGGSLVVAGREIRLEMVARAHIELDDVPAPPLSRPAKLIDTSTGTSESVLLVEERFSLAPNGVAWPVTACHLEGLGLSDDWRQRGKCRSVRFFAEPEGRFVVARLAETSVPRAILLLPSLERVPLPKRMMGLSLAPYSLRRSLGVPLGWTLGGAVSLLLACPLLLHAARARRRASSVVGRDAVFDGERRVTFGDGGSARVADTAGLVVGPVVVEGGGPGGYRGDGAPLLTVAFVGTVAGRRQAFADHAGAFEGLAVAVVALGVAPLVAYLACLL